MKNWYLSIITVLIACVVFLIVSHNVYASTCAVKETIYSAPEFFLLSDTVFSGTVLHIDNTTDHQWKVFFTVDKMWKGSTSEKSLTVTTNTLQGCGYSITQGEKYLAYVSGYPSNLNILWTKSYADAQSNIALLDDPKFQAQAVADEELYKKLTTAKDMLSHTASNRSLPIFMSDVDEMTLTLVVGIDDTKTPLLSADGYQKMVKNIVGNIPVKIVFGHNEPLGYDISGLSLSPLKQFKSGIATKDIKCKGGLQLAIKTEDNSPACVKPGHLTRLSQYGWTIPHLKIISDTDTANNDGLSETNCGQFYTLPENKSDSNEIPVLILKQNSIGCAKITFTVNFLFNNTNDCVGCNSQMVKTAEFLSIGKYNFSRHGDLISGSSGKDYTNSFQIAAVPKTVDVSKYPIGSNFTVVFTIKPLLNATGFYDYSIVKPTCNAYPLVVGYSPDQVNSSDFSEGLSFMQNHPCIMGSYGYSKVQVSGISYVQMKLN